MHLDRKPEGRRQTGVFVIPAASTIVWAPDPVMVLLKRHIALARRSHHVMHAVFGLAVPWSGRMVDRIARLVVRQAVAALPSRTALLGRKHPRSGYSGPDSLRVGRVCHHGVKDQPCCSRRPAVRRRMGGQPLDRFPGCTVIAAGQKTCGFGPGIENAAGEGEAPILRESVAEGQGGRRSGLSSSRNRSRSPPSHSSGPARHRRHASSRRRRPGSCQSGSHRSHG